MGSIANIGADQFEAEVLQSDRPVIVDFWATWCGPCLRQAPILEELARKRTDVKVVKVDVDQNPDLAMTYGVQSIPTIMVFAGGKAAVGRVGVQSLPDLETMVSQASTPA